MRVGALARRQRTHATNCSGANGRAAAAPDNSRPPARSRSSANSSSRDKLSSGSLVFDLDGDAAVFDRGETRCRPRVLEYNPTRTFPLHHFSGGADFVAFLKSSATSVVKGTPLTAEAARVFTEVTKEN